MSAKIDDTNSPQGLSSLNNELSRKRNLGIPSDGASAGDLGGVYIQFTGTGSEQAVSHSLGRTPVGWITVHKSATGDVWNGTRTWTDQQVFLVATNAVVFKLMLY